jgi:hypothetical protein
MFRKLFMLLVLLSIFSALHATRILAQAVVPTTKEFWIQKLTGLTLQDAEHRQALQQFCMQDPDLAYSVYREVWTKIKEPSVRFELVDSFFRGNNMINGVEVPPYQPNPHLLDMMALALAEGSSPGEDKPGAQRNIAGEEIRQELLGVATHEITGLEDFKKWRDTVADRPITAIVQENSRRVVNELENGTADQKLKTLELLRKITYYTGTSISSVNGVTTRGHTAAGLMKVRRDALLEAKLPAALGKLLRPENPAAVRQDSARVLARFQPDDSVLRTFESDLMRELPALMELPADALDRNNPFRQPDNLTELLGAFAGDWATDLIVKLLQKSTANGAPDWRLTNALQYSHSPRVIPALIGLLETADTAGIGYNPYENCLRQITQIGWNGAGRDSEHDGLWWRVWWHDNKKRYPVEVQNLPIPNFQKTNKSALDTPLSIASRRRVERMYVSEDPKRSYWLLSPGSAPPVPLTDVERAAIANSGLKKLAAVKPDRPGLVVVLSDGDTSDGTLLDLCLDVCDGLDRRYFVAVAIRPKWTEKTADRWLTLKDRSEAPAAEFTTESFVEQIVRQMESNTALDPNRIYLAAEGKAGTAAYTCALQKSTAFRGFCLLSAPFRSTILPPLSAAKNRRFFLALGIQGNGGMDTLAAASEPILRQQGAIVRTGQIKTGSPVEAIQTGIHWLER